MSTWVARKIENNPTHLRGAQHTRAKQTYSILWKTADIRKLMEDKSLKSTKVKNEKKLKLLAIETRQRTEIRTTPSKEKVLLTILIMSIRA